MIFTKLVSVARSLPVDAPDFGAAVWRADALACAAGATLASGHAALDSELPGGGWPVGAICEILQDPNSCQEWRLLLPALSRLIRAASGCVALVGPPQQPFGPGLAAQGLAPQRLLWVSANTPVERLWVTEQALCCADVAAVLVWLGSVRCESLRRLQIAAQAHGKLLFVLRPTSAQNESSPAVLRLHLGHPGSVDAVLPDDTLQLHILKRRGPPLARALAFSARPSRLTVLLAPQRPAMQESADALDRFAAAA